MIVRMIQLSIALSLPVLLVAYIGLLVRVFSMVVS